jgi:hypothetical protein
MHEWNNLAIATTFLRRAYMINCFLVSQAQRKVLSYVHSQSSLSPTKCLFMTENIIEGFVYYIIFYNNLCGICYVIFINSI